MSLHFFNLRTRAVLLTLVAPYIKYKLVSFISKNKIRSISICGNQLICDLAQVHQKLSTPDLGSPFNSPPVFALTIGSVSSVFARTPHGEANGLVIAVFLANVRMT